MSDDVRCVQFVGSLPPIQSAITMDGIGDGARIKIDIPASDVGAVLLLQHYFTGRVFSVTVERMDMDPIEQDENGTNRHSNTRKLHI